MFPDNSLAPDAPKALFLPPTDVPRSPLEDLEYGGIALNDPSQGHLVQVWLAYRPLLETGIWVRPWDNSVPAVMVQDTGSNLARDIGLGFDQNMRPVVCWSDNGSVFLSWYDGTIPGVRVSSWPGRSPVVTLDDKRDESTTQGTNDVLLLYMDGIDMKMRRQRDRYETEFILASPGEFARINRAGMNRALRLQIEVEGATA